MNKRTIKTIILGAICVNMVALISLTTEVNTIKGSNTFLVDLTEPKEFIDSLDIVDSLVNNTNETTAYYQAVVDSIETKVENNFKYVFPKFKKFNKNIDTATVETFVGVMNAFGLDENEEYREMYTGQILLESGAKQYRPSGELVVSSAGCIGLCQIMPSTALGYIQKHADTTDIKVLKILGASDFSFAFEDTLSNSQKKIKTREWLSDVTNNIIMWGFISRHNLDKRGDIITQLVSYNMGSGGANKFIANGGNVNNHKYIRGIQSKLLIVK